MRPQSLQPWGLSEVVFLPDRVMVRRDLFLVRVCVPLTSDGAKHRYQPQAFPLRCDVCFYCLPFLACAFLFFLSTPSACFLPADAGAPGHFLSRRAGPLPSRPEHLGPRCSLGNLCAVSAADLAVHSDTRPRAPSRSTWNLKFFGTIGPPDIQFLSHDSFCLTNGIP